MVSGAQWANFKDTAMPDFHLVHLQDSHNRSLSGRLSVVSQQCCNVRCGVHKQSKVNLDYIT